MANDDLCVRRSWDSLLSPWNSAFTSVHFSRSTGHFILQEPLTFKSKFFIVELLDQAFVSDVQYALPKYLPPTDFWVANSCHGLLCLAASRKPYYPIKLSNPITGEYVNLPQHVMNYGFDVVVSGLGLTSATKKFKVVRLVYSRRQGSSSNPLLRLGPSIMERMIEVYTLGTNSWRILGTVPTNVPSDRGVYLNGAFHWASNNKHKHKRANSDYIISFDLETETFGTVPPPVTLTLHPEGPDHFIKTGVVGKFLYLRCNNEFWVMKEYGVQESWVKLCVDDTSLPSYQPIKYLRGGEILMKLGGLEAKLISYDPVKETSKEFELPKLNCQFGVINYVPCFMPIRDILSEKDKSAVRYLQIKGEKLAQPSSSSNNEHCIDDGSDDDF
ncbi:hypothetical protein ACFE04_025463 [Oxalis oulophora]